MNPVPPPRRRAVLVLALAAAACGDTGEGEAPPPLRAKLFDHMAEAELTGVPGLGAEPSAPAAARPGGSGEPPRIWFARPDRRGLRFDEDPGEAVRLDPDGAGSAGVALQIGPGVPEDRSRAVWVVSTSGLERVRVAGRVRLEGNPLAAEASSREVLRVVEHPSEVEDPSRVGRWGRMRATTHRVSRTLDPSGRDRFELELVTRSTTRALEVQLLHRSGDSEDAVTRFDSVVLESTPLTEGEVYGHLAGLYRPRDGREAETPWRLRVPLEAADGGREEVRDAVLLPPPARLAIPVRLPAAETSPRLRFHYGMLPEAFDAPGDGARIEVRFEDGAGEAVALGAVELDPKRDEEQRLWLAADLDLAPAAGREGRLVFQASDERGSEPDALDAVVLATPRIEPAALAPAGFNVLLIGVDTLRADRLSAFGYGRPTTPHLERLADEGVRFLQARSQAPWTLPSFSSILTSLYPSVHGAGRGGHDEWTPIDPTTTSLAEILARVGYLTQGIVANGLITPRYGLDQGFEAYQSAWIMESVERDVPAVRAFIEGHRTTPWFLFWHVMDPHLPYWTEGGFREEFTDPGYDGRFARGDHPSVPFHALDPRPGRRWFAHEGPPPPDLDEADRRFVHDFYDAEIAEVDAAVGEVLESLRASGQWERTVVALVSDHGEGLGDHGHYHHGYTLHDDQVHVPMLLRVPGRHAGKVIERPVASIDLAPTLLGVLGLEPPEFFQGVDRLARDAPPPGSDPYFIEYPTYDSSAQKAWVEGDFKYLHDPVFHTEALYHLGRDPGELRDVAAEHPAVVARARAELDAFRWEHIQRGRYHLRLRGRAGQRLTLQIRTDDLFDANFACRPEQPEERFQLDLERRNLGLETTLAGDRLELVFWCRGGLLNFDVALDGEPLPGGLELGDGGPDLDLPAAVEPFAIPRASGRELGWPAAGQAPLWLERGARHGLPVVSSPEEIELLQELGYAR